VLQRSWSVGLGHYFSFVLSFFSSSDLAGLGDRRKAEGQKRANWGGVCGKSRWTTLAAKDDGLIADKHGIFLSLDQIL
jgi:hypothetical protein